jgi:hypothetical protein
MAFCSSCGGQIEGNERFCPKCGADQKAQAAGAPAVPAAAAPASAPQTAAPQVAFPPSPAQQFPGTPPQYPPPPGQPYAGMPPQYPPPHPGQPFAGMPPQYPPPIIMGAPPGAPPAGKNPLVWLVAAGLIFGLWYIGTHDSNNQNPGTTPTPQTQPGQQPAGGGGGGGGGGNQDQAVVAAQKFTEGSYNAVNGQIQVLQGQWLNGSNVALQAAQLGCEQMDANGQNLTQDSVTLPGPAQPGQTVALATFSIGTAAQGAAKVNCKITAVETVN